MKAREYVIGTACIHAEKFTMLMHTWLRDDANWSVWLAFEREANAKWDAGRRRYSSKNIIDLLRYDTQLFDSGKQFKINDHIQPSLGRLYMVVYPERAGFFEVRGRRAA